MNSGINYNKTCLLHKNRYKNDVLRYWVEKEYENSVEFHSILRSKCRMCVKLTKIKKNIQRKIEISKKIQPHIIYYKLKNKDYHDNNKRKYQNKVVKINKKDERTFEENDFKPRIYLNYQKIYKKYSNMFNSVKDFSSLLYVNSKYKISKSYAKELLDECDKDNPTVHKYNLIKIINFDDQNMILRF